MQNVALCLIFLASFLVSPPVVFSIEEQMIEETENASMELSGEVAGIDIENQQIFVDYQLDDREAVITAVFYLSETTKIYKDGENIPTFDLKEGDAIVVTYQIDYNGRKVISKVTILNQ